jgi:hypothetical protein
LEKFCQDSNLNYHFNIKYLIYFILEKFKLVKSKRKLVGFNEFNSFDSYVQSIKERSSFEGSSYDLSNLIDDLNTYHDKYSSYFYLIEPLNVSYELYEMKKKNLN